MFKDKYPHLYERCNKKFGSEALTEHLLSLLKSHYGDLLNFEVLEHLVETNQVAENYYQHYFTKFLNCLYENQEKSDAQLLRKLSNNLRNMVRGSNTEYSDSLRARSGYIKRRLYVPPISGHPSPQLGFHEKIYTGQMHMPAALNRFDVLRHVEMQHRKTRVFSLAEFEARIELAEDSEALIDHNLAQENASLMINLTTDPTELPKWISIYKNKSDQIEIYCESRLTSKEKATLNAAFGEREINYHGQNASLGISSGYTALAFLNKQKTMNGMNLDTDFSALLQEYIQCSSFAHDNSHLDYDEHQQLLTSDDEQYITSAYRNISDKNPTRLRFGGSPYIIGAEYDAIMTSLADIPGYTAGSRYDITAALEHVQSKSYSSEAIKGFSRKYMSSYLAGIERAMKHDGYLFSTPEATTVRLDDIDRGALELYYTSIQKEYFRSGNWFHHLTDEPSDEPSKDKRLKINLLTSAFRVATKKHKLTVIFPTAQTIPEATLQFLEKSFDAQPYTCELELPGRNASLNSLNVRLQPTLVRNKFLKSQDYLPNMSDDYWYQAAKKWLLYIANHPDSAINRQDHGEFITLTTEMGLKGFKKILSVLDNPVDELILERQFKHKHPALNANSSLDNVSAYLTELSAHLESNKYFPFEKLTVSFNGSELASYSKLLENLNQRQSFDKLYIEDIISSHPDPEALKAFIDGLIEKVIAENIHIPVVMPDLEGEVPEEYFNCVDSYRLLNDIILNNRRKLDNPFLDVDIDEEEIPEEAFDHDAVAESSRTIDISSFIDKIRSKSWSVSREDEPQMQVQQQQQIAVVRQLQVEQKVERDQYEEQPLPPIIITYENIATNTRLAKLIREKHIDVDELKVRYAALSTPSAHPLQDLFYTWRNASLSSNAPQAISGMTEEAASQLLLHADKFSNGIARDNLPLGFFCQHDEEGKLILGYNPELGYTTGRTAHTVDLSYSKPLELPWQGDYRQFSLAHYRAITASRTAEELIPSAIGDMILYQRMQPALTKTQTDSLYRNFSEKYPTTIAELALTDQEVQVVKDNWILFDQAFISQKTAGMIALMNILRKVTRFHQQKLSLEELANKTTLSLPEDKALYQRILLLLEDIELSTEESKLEQAQADLQRLEDDLAQIEKEDGRALSTKQDIDRILHGFSEDGTQEIIDALLLKISEGIKGKNVGVEHIGQINLANLINSSKRDTYVRHRDAWIALKDTLESSSLDMAAKWLAIQTAIADYEAINEHYQAIKRVYQIESDELAARLEGKEARVTELQAQIAEQRSQVDKQNTKVDGLTSPKAIQEKYSSFKRDFLQQALLFSQPDKLSDTSRLQQKATIYHGLFNKAEHKAFCIEHFDEQQLKSLGRVYNQYGAEGVHSLVKRFKKIHDKCGSEFFERFKQIYLENESDFRVFVGIDEFAALDDMVQFLSNAKNKNLQPLFLTFSDKHLDPEKGVKHEKHYLLWKAFYRFQHEVHQQAIELSGNELDRVEPGNMLTLTDRIISCLSKVTDQDNKQHLLSNLSEYDLTHGGIYYATNYDQLRLINHELMLHDFHSGTPSYAPNLATIYQAKGEWNATNFALYFQRALAGNKMLDGRLHHQIVSAYLPISMEHNKGDLVLLCLTNIQNISEHQLDKLKTLTTAEKDDLATHLLIASQYIHRKKTAADLFPPTVNMDIDLSVLLTDEFKTSPKSVLDAYPLATYLEVATILQKKDRLAGLHNINAIMLALKSESRIDTENINHMNFLKACIILGIEDKQVIQDVFNVSPLGARPIKGYAIKEMQTLVSQILSIRYDSSREGLAEHIPSEDFKKCLTDMHRDSSQAANKRISYIKEMQELGYQFALSESGKYKRLEEDDRALFNLEQFEQHEKRLWLLFKNHLVAPVEYKEHVDDEAVKASFEPLMIFFSTLKSSLGVIDEIEPLLSSLIDIEAERYWPVEVFNDLIRCLQPTDQRQPFPLNLFCELLKEPLFAAKPFDALDSKIPEELTGIFKLISDNVALSSEDKTLFCKLALKEFKENNETTVTEAAVNAIGVEELSSVRSIILNLLIKTSEPIDSYFETINTFVTTLRPSDEIGKSWPLVTKHWFENINQAAVSGLYQEINRTVGMPSLRSRVFHIMAFALLDQSMQTAKQQQDAIDRKSAKLLKALKKLNLSELQTLANCYPSHPCPNAHDLLRIIKRSQDKSEPLQTSIEHFQSHSDVTTRIEHQQLLSAREKDFKRLIADTHVTTDDGTTKRKLNLKEITLISGAFNYLKSLESGENTIDGLKVSLMTKAQLQAAINTLSTALKSTDLSKAEKIEKQVQLWALLFESMGRTTHKYPHLAQQYSLLVNDLVINSQTRALRLATGEGKSHFVALRAAKHALSGKTVEICTAKQSLAERDLSDYQYFYDYVGVKGATISPGSSKESYEGSQIHFTTLGGLSLFLDQQSSEKQQVRTTKENRVILFDEFDYIFFEEGRNTCYNFANSSGRTPKQLMWFYRGLDQYYQTIQDEIDATADFKFTATHIEQLLQTLLDASADNPGRQYFIQQQLINLGAEECIKWLQAAHQAYHLEEGVHYTIRDKVVEYGGVHYPMRELIPLSRDNQPVLGSSFSGGVHQLLAVRHNLEVSDLEKQNHHVHSESDILSAQMAMERTKELTDHWEGFSGSTSVKQSHLLKDEFGTVLLDVPTNSVDQRQWHPPVFVSEASVDDDHPDLIGERRFAQIVAQLEKCKAKSQSVLFACKDDTEVKFVVSKLEELYGDDYEKYFMHYTNDDPRTSKQVLEDKFAKEGREGDSKQRPVCLIASNFGRGDNVKVDAVMLASARDHNDMLQKGGRTARNGAFGEVFQFYDSHAFVSEYVQLQQERSVLRSKSAIDIEAATTHAVRLMEAAPTEFRDAVFSLREEVALLKGKKEILFKRLKAQYSSWLMTLLARDVLTDEQDRSLRRLSLETMSHLEDSWQLRLADAHPDAQAEILNQLFSDSLSELQTTMIELYEDLTPDLFFMKFLVTDQVISEAQQFTAQAEDAFSILVALAASLFDKTGIELSSLDEIEPKLLEIQKYPAFMGQLLARAEYITTWSDFVDEIDNCYELCRSPSDAADRSIHFSTIGELLRTLPNKKSYETLMENIPANTKDQKRNFRRQIEDFLIAPTTSGSAEDRVNITLELMEYLSSFSVDQAHTSLDSYLQELDLLCPIRFKNTEEQFRIENFNSGFYQLMKNASTEHQPLLSASHFLEIRKLIFRYGLEDYHRDHYIQDIDHLFVAKLKALYQYHPQQASKYLINIECWAQAIIETPTLKQKKSLIQDWSIVVDSFLKNDKKEELDLLMRHFGQWFNDNGGKYQPELIKMIHLMADSLQKNPAEVVDLTEWLAMGYEQTGKSQFQFIQSILALPNNSRIKHSIVIKDLWRQLQSDAPKYNNSLLADRLRVEGFDKKATKLALFQIHSQKLIGRKHNSQLQSFLDLDTLRHIAPRTDNSQVKYAKNILNVAVKYLQHNPHSVYYFGNFGKHTNQVPAQYLVNRVTALLSAEPPTFTEGDLNRLLMTVIKSMSPSLFSGSLERDLFKVIKSHSGTELQYQQFKQKLSAFRANSSEAAIDIGTNLFQQFSQATAADLLPPVNETNLHTYLANAGSEYLKKYKSFSFFNGSHLHQPQARQLMSMQDEKSVHVAIDNALLILNSLKFGELSTSIIQALKQYYYQGPPLTKAEFEALEDSKIELYDRADGTKVTLETLLNEVRTENTKMPAPQAYAQAFEKLSQQHIDVGYQAGGN